MKAWTKDTPIAELAVSAEVLGMLRVAAEDARTLRWMCGD